MANLVKALKIGPAWTKPQELTWLARQAAGCERILELGCYHGRSTRALLDNSKAQIWCVDTWRGRITKKTTATDKDYKVFLAGIADCRERVTVLKMSTQKAVPVLAKAAPFDLVFIDADHTYEFVKHDILAFGPMVRPGGILCGHDYFHKAPGLIRAVDELLGKTNKIATIWWIRKEMH